MYYLCDAPRGNQHHVDEASVFKYSFYLPYLPTLIKVICQPPAIASVGKIVRAKLPKLELRKYNGKICEWQEFWDGFSSSIDNNEQLSDVDKFAYLRGLLEEPAKSTIAGFSLTEANYMSAVELLKKRFDKKSAVQRAHVNELIQLSPVFKERDTRGLRNLYDSCEAHNRALKALGVSEESYSSIVVPVIVEKLAESFRLTITRGTDFLQWSMEEMLDAFVRELELREAHMPWERLQ